MSAIFRHPAETYQTSLGTITCLVGHLETSLRDLSDALSKARPVQGLVSGEPSSGENGGDDDESDLERKDVESISLVVSKFSAPLNELLRKQEDRLASYERRTIADVKTDKDLLLDAEAQGRAIYGVKWSPMAKSHEKTYSIAPWIHQVLNESNRQLFAAGSASAFYFQEEDGLLMDCDECLKVLDIIGGFGEQSFAICCKAFKHVESWLDVFPNLPTVTSMKPASESTGCSHYYTQQKMYQRSSIMKRSDVNDPQFVVSIGREVRGWDCFTVQTKPVSEINGELFYADAQSLMTGFLPRIRGADDLADVFTLALSASRKESSCRVW